MSHSVSRSCYSFPEINGASCYRFHFVQLLENIAWVAGIPERISKIFIFCKHYFFVFFRFDNEHYKNLLNKIVSLGKCLEEIGNLVVNAPGQTSTLTTLAAEFTRSRNEVTGSSENSKPLLFIASRSKLLENTR